MEEADIEEMLCVLDENGNSTGKLEKKSIVHANKIFHNEIVLWIIDKQNKSVLLERRSANKKLDPNKLAPVAGHVSEYETLEEALFRETLEEIGVDVSSYEIKKLCAYKVETESNCCFQHHYYTYAKLKTEELKIQLSELSEVLYVDYLELKHKMLTDDDDTVFKKSVNHVKLFECLDKVVL